MYSSNVMASPLIVLVEHPSVAFFPVHSPMIMFSVSACSSQKYALRAVRYVITKGPKEMPVQISLPPKTEVAVDDCELVPVEMTVVDADDVFVLVAVEEPVSVTDDDAVRVPDDDTVVVSDIETVDVAVVVADSLNVVTTVVLCEVVAVDDAVADCDDVAVDVPDTEPVLVADECTDDVTVVLAVVTSQSRNTPALASVMASFSLFALTVQVPPTLVISSPFRQPTVPSIPGKPSRCDISRISLFTAVAVAAHALKGDTVIEDSPPTASWLQLTDPIESLS